jgi:beta-lactamase regulating signal transducer with metallopeptidase domain
VKLLDEALAMWVWLDRLGPILFDAGLSTAIFLSLVVLAMLVCRQPSRRRLIARIAFPASLAMIPLVALAPLPRLDLVDTFVRWDLLPPVMIVGSDQTAATASQSPSHGMTWRSRIADFLRNDSPGPGSWLPRALVLLDLLCVALGIAWLLLGFWGVRWLIRHSREPSARTRELYRQLLDGQAKRRIRPALRVSARVQHPVVVGIRHPTIVIPPTYDEPETGKATELLRLSLLHEIAHAEQADPWFGTVASLAQTTWFFLPQIWWLRSQLLIDQEFLADKSAAYRYGTSSDYAASLLTLATSRPVQASATGGCKLRSKWLSGAKHGRSPLFQRLAMLLYCPFRVEERAPPRWSWTLRVGVLAASIAAACLCIRWPDARALENRMYRQHAGGAGSFRVKEFVAEPVTFGADGRAVPYVMPLPLPKRFDLSVEVLASPSDLSRIHIAGHPLGPAPDTPESAAGTTASPEDAKTWHPVRLQRSGEELSLWVDGQKMPTTLKADQTSESLTFEPGPSRPAHFRNLIVDE